MGGWCVSRCHARRMVVLLSMVVPVAVLLSGVTVNAEVLLKPGSIRVGGAAVPQAARPGAQAYPQPQSIRRSLARLDYDSLSADMTQSGPTTGHRSVGRRIAGGALGSVGGFFAGGFLGAKIDGECDCDDPGFKGFLIGAPVGAIVGAILGARFF